MHKVSAIIPTYNSSAEQLSLSVTSVLEQSYPNIEIIVVDDGSKHAFSGIESVKAFSLKPITWHRLSTNSGVAFARNCGAEMAQGELLAFLDAGDWWEPDKLEEQVAAFARDDNVGLIYTSAVVHHPKVTILLEATVEEDAYHRLLVSQPITGSASGVLMPKDVFKKVGGFFEKYDIPEDRDLWLRVSENYRVLAVKRPLVHLEVNPQGRSADPGKKLCTYYTFLNIHKDRLSREGKWLEAKSGVHVSIGKKALRSSRPFLACKHFAQAAIINPRWFVRAASRRLLF